jgi:hypothetical protein
LVAAFAGDDGTGVPGTIWENVCNGVVSPSNTTRDASRKKNGRWPVLLCINIFLTMLLIA